ncbi:MAG: FimV/HubP family polar landmark protein [Mariprofundales bacterium]|nr:FimV/HubP family polar landmark protein [Mariprofundales bacterium]
MKRSGMKYGVLFGALLLCLQPTTGSAVALGRIDVASKLGAPFFAEAPLKLDNGEHISSVFVALATPAEYQILEIYHDGALALIHARIKQGAHGMRVELSSKAAIQSPFINIVLRVRYGRATNFKKYPIFLKLPKSVTPNLSYAPKVTPHVQAVEAPQKSVTTAATTEKTAASAFVPYSGWARTGHYGPMVYGDTISIVAKRLRIDRRYSVYQVAMALFNKNRAKFSKDNINLIKSGSYLKTPTAKEVEQLDKQQALLAIRKQNIAWKALTKQSQYARIAEAQKNRYTKRVRVGSKATGVRTATPVIAQPLTPKVVPIGGDNKALSQQKVPVATHQEATAAVQPTIASLTEDNAILQVTLTADNARISKLENQLAANQQADKKIKRLEVSLLHMQRQMQTRDPGTNGMLLWLLYAATVVIVLLLVMIGVILRRQPKHPAAQQRDRMVGDPPSAPSNATANQPRVDAVAPSHDEGKVVVDDRALAAAPSKITEPTPSELPAALANNPRTIDHTETEIEPARVLEEDATDGTIDHDANVDHLAEADVYLRYGMEEEAEKHLHAALDAKPDDPIAHAKLVEMLQTRGDQKGAEAAHNAALLALSDENRVDFLNRLTGALATEHAASESVPPTQEVSAPLVEEGSSSEDSLTQLLTVSDEGGDLDDDLETLLATVGVDSNAPMDEEAVAEEHVLDLSMDDDTDLDALISSMDTSSDEEATEELPATPSTPPAAVADSITDDALNFDLTDVDMRGAHKEEPLVNRDATADSGELDFALDGLDLGNITLPGADHQENPPTNAGSDDSDEVLLTAEVDSGEGDTPANAPRTEEIVAVSEAVATSDTISLAMDDLDLLLADEGTAVAEPASPSPKRAVPDATSVPTGTDQPSTVDLDNNAELAELLDGLGDIDIDEDATKKS